MKKYYILIITLLLSIASNAQPIPTVIVGSTPDTLVLTVNGANGTIQWQESTDSISWSNIIGATINDYEVITDNSVVGKHYYRAEISNSTICENSTWYSSIIMGYKVINSITELEIGDWYKGGVVFYFLVDGDIGYVAGETHGLIAPQQDQSSGVEWGCDGTSIVGATSTSDGAANTTAIVAACSTRPIAASICDTLTINGYDDWFLPAIDQLTHLYQQKNLVGGFTNDYYRSSTEYTSATAWTYTFNGGYSVSYNKYVTYRVRAVRAF